MMKLTRQVDMLGGSLFKGIILYSIPLVLSRVFQLLYSAADLMVVGNFCDSQSLAAVGSNGAVVGLIVNCFTSLSLGITMTVSRRYGASDYEGVSNMIHTAMPVSVIFGVVSMIVGLIFSRDILVLMDTPSDVIDLSALYLKIYFAGVPAIVIYNFGAAVLMALGDTQRPLYILIVSGAVNVVLNIISVVFFGMGVSGVASATSVSNAVAAVAVVVVLMRSSGACKLYFRKMRIRLSELWLLVRLGLPASIQGMLFSITNMMVQASLNIFGSAVIAGNAAANNLGDFVLMAMQAFEQSTTTFTAQNYGAKNYKRMYRVCYTALFLVTVCGMLISAVIYIFGEPLLALYNPEPETIKYGMLRVTYMILPYFLAGIMNVLIGAMRGMGSSFLPMCSAIMSTIVLRIIYLRTVFIAYPSPVTVFLSYPITWLAAIIMHTATYTFMRLRLRKRIKNGIQ